MKAYSLDLRKRVVEFVEAGHSRHEAARHFGVSVSFVVNLVRRYHSTGNYAPKAEGGWRYSKIDPHRDFVLRRIAEKPDITMPELARELAAKETNLAPASLSRWLRRNGYRFKKNAAGLVRIRVRVDLPAVVWRSPLSGLLATARDGAWQRL